MNDAQLEWIVREVVRRLLADTISHAQSPAVEEPSASILKIDKPLVTLECLPRDLTKYSLVSIPPRAVVTPSVRDTLKQRNIRLTQGSASPQSVTPTPRNSPRPINVLAADIESDYRSASLAALVAPYGANLSRHPAANLAAVIAAQVPQVVQNAAKAVWFTPFAAQAVCLANRHPGAWAVVGHDGASLKQTLYMTSVNILVINPASRSTYGLRQMLSLFLEPSK